MQTIQCKLRSAVLPAPELGFEENVLIKLMCLHLWFLAHIESQIIIVRFQIFTFILFAIIKLTKPDTTAMISKIKYILF